MNKWGVGLTFLLAATSVMAKDIQLLNVSYDPTRELYEQYNKVFSAHWKQQTGDNVGDPSVPRWFRQTSDVGNQRY